MLLAKVGITGGIAEGKSTVLQYLREAGYRVASADEEARALMADPDVRVEVARRCGLGGDFQRSDLRDRLTGSDEARRALNELLHPRIFAALRTTRADFIEVPLLIEAALQGYFDQVWVVTCGPAEQRRRLIQRVGDEGLADRLLGLQLPTAAKVPFGQVILRTNLAPTRVKAYTLETALAVMKGSVAQRAK